MSYQSFSADLTLLRDGRLNTIWRDPNRRVGQGDYADFTSGAPLWLTDTWNLPGFNQLPHRFLDPTSNLVDEHGEENATELIGLVLFEMVLPGSEAQQAWIARFERAREDAGGVRLRLNLEAGLETLPWELLRAGSRWEDHGHKGFLALDDRFSIVRSGKPIASDDDAPNGAGAPANGEQPLRLLLVDAGRSPMRGGYGALTTAERTTVDRLELRESSRVVAALDHRTVTAEELARAIHSDAGANVFHFSGHGDEASGTHPPSLILAARKPLGEERIVDAARLSAEELGENLRRAKIEIAVLAACHAGTGAWWSGFGATLLDVGIPATVSMQALLENEAGDVFCKELYRKLDEGADLDSAVAAARHRVFCETSCKDWWLPLLHTRHEPLRFRPTARQVPPTLSHESDRLRPEIPIGEEKWLSRPGSWDSLPALSPDGQVWAFRTDEGLRLRTVDSDVNVLVPVDGDSLPIAVSPIKDGGVRVLTASARSTDWFVDLNQNRPTQVDAENDVATCAAWVENRFVWSDAQAQTHDARDLGIAHCTHISSATGLGVTLTAWIDAESTLTLHRATDAGVDLLRSVRLPDTTSPVDELIVAPTSETPKHVWIRVGLVWSGWTWDGLSEGAR